MNHTRSNNNLLSNRPLLLLWAQFFGRTQSELTICKGNNKYLVNGDGPPWLWKGAALLSNYGIPTFFLLLCWISFFGEIKKYTSCVLKKNLKVKTEKLKKKIVGRVRFFAKIKVCNFQMKSILPQNNFFPKNSFTLLLKYMLLTILTTTSHYNQCNISVTHTKWHMATPSTMRKYK